MEVHKFNSLIKNRNENLSSFKLLYEYFFPRIVLHISRKYKSEKLGEDIAQDFFIKLKKLNIDYIIKSPTAWVFTICNNLVKDKLSKEKIEYEYQYKDELSIGQNDLEYIFSEQIYIKSFLNQLDEKSQQILYLVYWEGYNLREIAQMYKMKYTTVKQKHRRGLKKLKIFINDVSNDA